MNIETLLIIIAVLLFMIFWKVESINARLKERFPTAKEEDREWARKDPMGHSEAHGKGLKK
jgi:hypothetical protein